MPDDPRSVVERYFAAVADLSRSPDALPELLHPDFRVVEHPNAIHPEGMIRDREAALSAHRQAKAMLAEQSFELDEVLVSGNRVVVRATWRGRLTAGASLEAKVASFLTVAEGQIREHETFDCYAPFER
jgi:ketosteroid isomerase-like protein